MRKRNNRIVVRLTDEQYAKMIDFCKVGKLSTYHRPRDMGNRSETYCKDKTQSSEKGECKKAYFQRSYPLCGLRE